MGTPYIGDFFLFTFSFSLFTFYFPTLSSSNKTTIFVLIGTNEFKYAPYLLLLLCRTPDLSGGGYSCIIHKTTNNTKAPPKWSFFVLSHVQFFSHRPSGNPGAAYCPAVAGRQQPGDGGSRARPMGEDVPFHPARRRRAGRRCGR